MFLVNSYKRACLTLYTGNRLLYNASYGILFRLPHKLVDALTYVRSYKFSPHMGTDPRLTTPSFKRCVDVDWDKVLTNNGIVC